MIQPSLTWKFSQGDISGAKIPKGYLGRLPNSETEYHKEIDTKLEPTASWVPTH